MDRSKSLKKGAIAVLIFGLVIFVAWAALFVILGLGIKDFNFFQVHLMQLLATFYFNMDHLPLSIGVVAVCALAGIALILTIILSCVKRRGFAIFPVFFFILAAAAGCEAIANCMRFNNINGDPTGYLILITSGNLASTIMGIAVLGTAGLATVLGFIAWLLSLIHICKYPKGYKAKVEEQKQEEVPMDAEPLPAFADEPVPEERHLSEQAELLSMLKDLIHELRLNQPNNQTVTGATFSAPLVVQYFNGMNPVQQEAKKEEPKEEKPQYVEQVAMPEPYVEPLPEEPKQEEPQPEPEPVKEEPAPAPVVEEPVKEPEPAPAVVAPVEPAPEKKPIIRIPFEERMVKAEKEMKDNYNELKNEILSYGVKSRVSNSGDTFRLHRKTYIKLTIAGKSLKLYFALNPEDYRETTIPVQDASEKGIYEEIPLVFKVKSGLSMKRAKQLIADCMEKDNLTQGEIGKVNWVKEIAANLREAKKAKKDEEE